MRSDEESTFTLIDAEATQKRLRASWEERHARERRDRAVLDSLFASVVEAAQPLDPDLETELAILDTLLPPAVTTNAVEPAHADDDSLRLDACEPYSRPAVWGAYSTSNSDENEDEDGDSTTDRDGESDCKQSLAKRASTSGVDAKKRVKKKSRAKLSNPHQAGVLAGFGAMHQRSVVAISQLDPDLDHKQIEAVEAKIRFITTIAKSYKGRGTDQLADWSKHVRADIKQYFRLLWMAKQPNAVTVTIRLDHQSANDALKASRGTANHIAAIIERTLSKVGISTEMAFNLENALSASKENHPLHLHGVFCIPSELIEEVRIKLRAALAEDYRQRFNNVAVHIEAIRNDRWWAGYCVKEHDLTAGLLTTARKKKTVPNYASKAAREAGEALYEGLGELFGDDD